MIRTAVLQILLMPLPWRIRRPLLRTLFGYDIHATARIGISLVMPSQGLDMGAASCVGHLTIARGMDRIVMREGARIGHLNWLYGIPSSDSSLSHEPGRRPELIMDEHAAITRRHLIDCSDTVHIGANSAIAGYRTQIVTHGLSTTKHAGPHTKPITVGKYCLVGTGCILLGGARLPDYSALGAGSTLRGAFAETHGLYSGVPAERVTGIPVDSDFFSHVGW